MLTITDLVRIAIKEHKDDADMIAIAADSYAAKEKEVRQIQIDMKRATDRYETEIKELRRKLESARKDCPCPSAAMVYHGDPSGNNDSYHECRICGKTH